MSGNQQNSSGHAPHTELSAEDFLAWQALIERHIGVVITPQSRGFLQMALAARMRVLDLHEPVLYYQKLAQDSNSAFEWAQLLANLTVQETAFFRHRMSFDFVRTYLEKRLPARGQQALMLWSVGCSSGEEAYSLAITAAEALHGSNVPFGVLGSDISEAALAKARTGRYSSRRIANVPGDLLERYFVFHPERGDFSVTDQLGARVCFTRLNVLSLTQEPFFNLDVIYCHNLLIYFRRPKRHEILNQLAIRLAPGGILLLGNGEAAFWQHPELTAAGDGSVQAFIRKQERCVE